MPTNAELLARRTTAVPRGVATATPIFVDRAENGEIWDVEGRRYVDFAGGIAVLNTGHRHPKVMEAVQAQLARFTHTAFQVSAYDSYVELAERLNAMAPVEGRAKTIFFTTGAEAVENAVKIARAATGRSAVISFTGGFHGRTLLGMAMTGKVAPYKKSFGPLAAEIYHAPFPVPHYGVTVEDSLRAIDFIFRADVEPERVAALVIEPVQGEGGFHEAPPEFLRSLRALCDRHGILLVDDEVQAGIGRTGRMFGIEHSGVKPDLIAVAKSLAGGFPLSGVIGRAELMDTVEPGGLGGTYGGSPVACAAALAVLDAMADEHLLERADALGDLAKRRLAGLQGRNDLHAIASVRGRGAMIGFDIVAHPNGEPDGQAAKAVTGRALQDGLILLSCGVYGETIRLLFPLTSSEALVEEGFDILEGALRIP